MVNIGIYDSDLETQNTIEVLLNKFFKKAKLQFEILQYENMEEFRKRVRLKQLDILFLDIKRNELNGIEVAKELRKVNAAARLVYISKDRDCVPDLLDYEASGYIHKPIDENKFYSAIGRIIKWLFRNVEKFYFGADQTLCGVEKRKIVYFESDAHTILIHKEDKKMEQFRGKLTTVSKQLSDDEFLRVGQSYIVNMNKIYKLSKRVVLMDDSSAIPVSRSYSSDALKKFNEFTKKKKTKTLK